MTRAGFKKGLGWGFLAFLALGWAFIVATSLDYFSADTVPPFVIEKLPVRFEALWLPALEIHVASALVTFPACLALSTRALQRRRRVHRWLGRVTALLVLALLVPSGCVLAFEAKGGAAGTLGFLLSGALVFGFLVLGVRAARRGDLAGHARAMRHVLGQMSVAVTSRALLIVFDQSGMDPTTAYLAALWIPVTASALAAEWLSARPVLPRLSSLVPLPRSFP